jgi:hypothetical protein
MVNLYALEEQMRQRQDALRCELDDARVSVEARRRPDDPTAGDQIARPDPAQYGARIWRFRSLPAWSRGRSSTKVTDRGRL